MDFAVKIGDGHFGPRKFWHQFLPRLKFHNPGVSMTVNRTSDQSGPATMTIFFLSKNNPDLSTASSNNSTSIERVEVIDMKHKHESDILRELLKTTGAEEIKTTEEEKFQLQEIEEEKARSDQDRIRSRNDLEAKRREAQLLAQAREAVSVSTT